MRWIEMRPNEPGIRRGALTMAKIERKSGRERQIKRRSVDNRFVLVMLSVAGVLAVAIYFLHSLQVDRNADAFRQRARKAQEEGHSGLAIANYNQYLGFRPEDTETLAKVGQLIDENATAGKDLLRAYLTYEKVLLDEEGRDEIRRRLVDVAMRLGRFTDAKSHIEELLRKSPDDSELQFKLGVCTESLGDAQRAAELFRWAMDSGYREPPVFLQLANLLRREFNRDDEASALIDDMVAANPRSVDALLTRARLRISQGLVKEAEEDLARVHECDSANVEQLLLQSAVAIGDRGRSLDSLRQLRDRVQLAVDQDPEEAMLYQTLSLFELRLGNHETVEKVLRTGIQRVRSPEKLMVLLGDRLISQGKSAEAQKQLDRLRQMDGSEAFIDFLEARLHIKRGNVSEAISLLRSVQPRVGEIPRLHEMCCLNLAACFRVLGDRESQIRELKNAISSHSGSDRTQLRLASALRAVGNTDQALDIYRRLSHLPTVPLKIAHLEFVQMLKIPVDQRDWSTVEAAIEQVGEGSVDAALLQERMLRAAGKHDAANQLLDKLVIEYPTENVWKRMALVRMEHGEWNDADRVIKEAQKELGDTVSLRTVRAVWIFETQMENADKELEKLESDIDRFTDDSQFRLFVSLAEIHELLGDRESADRLWDRAVVLRPQDLHTRLRIIQFAVSGRDSGAADKHLEALRSIVGSESPFVLAAESLRLIKSVEVRQSDLDRARSLLKQVAEKKPRWSYVPLLLAMADELEGKLASASQHYLLAVRRGHREARAISRAAALLVRLRQYEKAEQLLSLLRYDASLTIRRLLRRLQAELAGHQGDVDRALLLAGEAVPMESRNAGEQIWLGRMYAQLGRTDEAEVAYRTAVKLGPTNPDSWVALFRFLHRQNRGQEIDTEIAAARPHLKMIHDPGGLAGIYDAAEKTNEANQYYRQLLAEGPQNAATRWRVARYYLRSKQDKMAEPLLRSLINPDNDYQRVVVVQGRRSLARVLAKRDYTGFQEAVRILDENIAESDVTARDQLLKARILAKRHHPGHLRDAMRILEELDRQDQLNSTSRTMLARLCDALGEKDAADRHWQTLQGSNADADHIAMYVRRQLKSGDFDLIPSQLNRLQKLRPSAALELTFRWRVAAGDVETGIELLQQYVARAGNTPASASNILFGAATLAEQVATGLERESAERMQLYSTSENWYRQILNEVPGATLSLVRLLGRTGRVSESLAMCESAQQSLKSGFNLTGIAMQVVRAPSATPDDVDRVEQWLQAAVDSDADSPVGWAQLAEFGLFHERYQQSFDIYERLLKDSPNHIIAKNNLAWLLSLWKGDHRQAENLIDLAIESAGPAAVLLDTRGTIRLNLGRFDLAQEDFRDAVTQNDSPSQRFHLAVAFWKRGSQRAALLNLRQALDAGFDIENLLPLERQAFGDDLREMRELMAEHSETL